MKKAALAALCLILSAAVLIPAYAGSVSLKLDGKNTGNEWEPYAYTELLDEDNSSNNIGFAGVKCAFDEFTSSVWYFFSFGCNNEPADRTVIGIKLKIENSEEITLQIGESDEAKTEIRNENYVIDMILTRNRDNSMYCEVKAVIRDGIGKDTDYSVVFIDDKGDSSVRKTMTVKNPDYETTESEQGTTSKSSNSVSDSDYAASSKASVTHTKRATTSYKSRVTTTAATTTEKQTSEKTTKEKTTRLKTTKVKTTKAKTTKAKKAKTTKAKSSKADTKSVYDTSVTEETENEGISATTFETDGASLTSAYKIAAGIAAAVLFAVVGVWAVRSHKDADRADKEEEKEKNPDDEENPNDK